MVPFAREGCDEHAGEVFCARGAAVLLRFLAGVASVAEVDVEEDCVVLGIQKKVGQRQGDAREGIEGDGSAERLGVRRTSPFLRRMAEMTASSPAAVERGFLGERDAGCRGLLIEARREGNRASNGRNRRARSPEFFPYEIWGEEGEG